MASLLLNFIMMYDVNLVTKALGTVYDLSLVKVVYLILDLGAITSAFTAIILKYFLLEDNQTPVHGRVQRDLIDGYSRGDDQLPTATRHLLRNEERLLLVGETIEDSLCAHAGEQPLLSAETSSEHSIATSMLSEPTRKMEADGPLGTENHLQLFSDPDTCLNILSGKTYSSDTPSGENQLSLEKSRAIPNQRLKRVFDIDNSFTTFDRVYREDFRHQISTHICAPSTGGYWISVAEHAQIVASQYAKKIPGESRHSLQNCVQVISLKIALKVFFKLEVDRLEDEVVLAIAQLVDRLLIQSRLSNKYDPAGIRQLKLHFKELGICWSRPRDNPLNLLLPGYDPTWRIVLHCLIEVVFRSPVRGCWHRDLDELLTKPADDVFFSSRVKPLVDEALRLYPPTKRVYRQFEFLSGKGLTELVAADIEACHRLPEVWGNDSNKYRPDRMSVSKRTPRMEKAFMPFGGPPWMCPASGKFAPRMIGILVAAIASTVSGKDWHLEVGSQADGSPVFLDNETDLSLDLAKANEWILVRKRPTQDEAYTKRQE